MTRPVNRRTALSVMGAGIIGAVMADPVAARANARPTETGGGLANATAASLADSGAAQPRWISRSMSRIVINPYDVLSSATPAEQSNRPDVPLNVAYFAHDGATRYDDLLMLDVRPAGDPPGYAEAAVGFDDDCTSPAGWSISPNVTLSAAKGVLTATRTTTGADAIASRSMTVDLDSYPLLRISVPRVDQTWVLRIARGSGATTVLQPITSTPGVFFYDVPKATGWSGSVDLTVEVLLGGASVSVDDVRLQSRPTLLAAFADDFSTTLDPGWAPGAAVRTEVADGHLNLSVPNSTGTWYGYVTRTFAVDLDAFPILKVKVDSVGQYWAIKVNNGAGPDVIVQNNTTQLGTFSFDLPRITGWSGTQTLSIRLFVNGYQTTASFDSVLLQARPESWLLPAKSLQTTWYPHVLPFEAKYENGTRIEGSDTMSGTDAVSRTFAVSGLPTGQSLQLSGQYFGSPSYDSASHTLTFALPQQTVTVALPDLASPPRFYVDRDSWSYGGPPVSGAPSTANGFWAVTLSARSAFQAQAGIGFAVSTEPAATSRTRAVAARAVQHDQVVAGNEREFNRILAAVPRPVDFAIRAVAAGGVSATQVWKMYYRAWVFLSSSLLPPEPETGRSRPLLATGKPALYLHGPNGAHAAASWDSEIGIQFLAYLDADAAWGALEALLDLVDANGVLSGEFLPARGAQTAWVLTCLTGDGDRLRANYPALKRLLTYKQDHPKYSGDTNPNDIDLPFVAHALIDTDFAVMIARRLGLDADVTYWNTRYANLNANMLGWFWKTPTSQPPQVVDPVAGTTSTGNVVSATDALHVRTLDDTHAGGLIQRFDSLYDPSKPLAGFGVGTNDVRYGITSHTIYGLLDHDATDRAAVFSNAILRDATRTDMFAERYQWDDTGIFPAGERPSLFGVGDIIDAVWMNNGFRMDGGIPGFVMLPDTDGGIDNLRFQNRRLDLRADHRTGRVTLAGNLVRPDPQCRSLRVPVGASMLLPDDCSTVSFQ